MVHDLWIKATTSHQQAISTKTKSTSVWETESDEAEATWDDLDGEKGGESYCDCIIISKTDKQKQKANLSCVTEWKWILCQAKSGRHRKKTNTAWSHLCTESETSDVIEIKNRMENVKVWGELGMMRDGKGGLMDTSQWSNKVSAMM